ncbi:MAG: histidine phosphatase family protein [Bacteroidetes bacterium]|nr:histidine phosphatase family protein [Bacteroidota bacterium]
MKQLVLIRHGTAVKGGSFGDICRPLKKTGVAEIIRTSAQLHNQKVSFSHIYSSPAARCYDTALVLATEFNMDFSRIHFLPELYMCDSKTLLQVVGKFDNKQQRMCLVGHNPCLDEVIASLQFKEMYSMQKGDAMVLQSKAATWSKFFDTAELRHYLPLV